MEPAKPRFAPSAASHHATCALPLTPRNAAAASADPPWRPMTIRPILRTNVGTARSVAALPDANVFIRRIKCAWALRPDQHGICTGSAWDLCGTCAGPAWALRPEQRGMRGSARLLWTPAGSCRSPLVPVRFSWHLPRPPHACTPVLHALRAA